MSIAKFHLITPQFAAQLLKARHPRQLDRFSETVANNYAAQMRDGLWDSKHPQGIAVSTAGELLDGQHRLEAVMRSGVEVNMLLVTDVDPETYKHIDAGFRRSVAFRAMQTTSDMAMYSLILKVCLYSQGMNTINVEDVERAAEFVKEPYEIMKANTPSTNRVRTNPTPVRLAVLLQSMRYPHGRETIFDAYGHLVRKDLKEAPRSVGYLYRMQAEQTFRQFDLLALAYVCFDVAKYENKIIKTPSTGDVFKLIANTTLAPLAASLHRARQE